MRNSRDGQSLRESEVLTDVNGRGLVRKTHDQGLLVDRTRGRHGAGGNTDHLCGVTLRGGRLIADTGNGRCVLDTNRADRVTSSKLVRVSTFIGSSLAFEDSLKSMVCVGGGGVSVGMWAGVGQKR